MAEITVGSKTLTIPQARVAKAAEYIKKWYDLDGETAHEILDAWSEHQIEEVKNYLLEQFYNEEFGDEMQTAEDDAKTAAEAEKTAADVDLVIT